MQAGRAWRDTEQALIPNKISGLPTHEECVGRPFVVRFAVNYFIDWAVILYEETGCGRSV